MAVERQLSNESGDSCESPVGRRDPDCGGGVRAKSTVEIGLQRLPSWPGTSAERVSTSSGRGSAMDSSPAWASAHGTPIRESPARELATVLTTWLAITPNRPRRVVQAA